ncbi:MAG: HAMP domain-containing protein, partial [Candidatus Eisenbacteria bacterium]|nr:HAMP domain-containing protein [Candidatus Eisenbacteria bacterium]
MEPRTPPNDPEPTVSLSPTTTTSVSETDSPHPAEAYSNLAVVDDIQATQLLEAVLALRQGDFSVRLPSNWAGVHGKIADAMNDILAMSERRGREMARITTTVGREGRLRARLSVPGLTGGWADELASLNQLIDDLVWPTTEVTRTIGAVAKGDLG